MTTQAIELVEVTQRTPIFDHITKRVGQELKTSVAELETLTNTAIERGVDSDDLANAAEMLVREGRQAVKLVNNIRLDYTRPVEEAKKRLMKEVETFLRPLTESNKRLDGLVLDRQRRIDEEKERQRLEHERQQREAEAKARAEEERRRKISLAKGGDGEVAPVAPQVVAPPVTTLGMRSTTRLRSIPDHEKIQAAIDNGIREIVGVDIYQVWQFKVVDAKSVPEEYRKKIRA